MRPAREAVRFLLASRHHIRQFTACGGGGGGKSRGAGVDV